MLNRLGNGLKLQCLSLPFPPPSPPSSVPLPLIHSPLSRPHTSPSLSPPLLPTHPHLSWWSWIVSRLTEQIVVSLQHPHDVLGEKTQHEREDYTTYNIALPWCNVQGNKERMEYKIEISMQGKWNMKIHTTTDPTQEVRERELWCHWLSLCGTFYINSCSYHKICNLSDLHSSLKFISSRDLSL